jgi:hypothetical protein
MIILRVISFWMDTREISGITPLVGGALQTKD